MMVSTKKRIKAIMKLTTCAQRGQFGACAPRRGRVQSGLQALFELARPVDDAGQTRRNGTDHSGHRGEQKHRRDGQLNAMRDGVGVWRGNHDGRYGADAYSSAGWFGNSSASPPARG